MPGLVASHLAASLSQGDLYPLGWDSDQPQPLNAVMVLSEGCEIDYSPTVLIAPFVRDINTSEDILPNILGGTVWRAFRLSELAQPGWVDLRRTDHADKELFLSRLDKRECSLTLPGRVALAGWYFAFLTHSRPPAAKYFRDLVGVVWDVFEVSVKDVRRTEDQVRGFVPALLQNGWLLFSSPRETKRLAPVPEGWQYYTDEQLSALTALATPAIAHVHCAAAEQAAKQRLAT